MFFFLYFFCSFSFYTFQFSIFLNFHFSFSIYESHANFTSNNKDEPFFMGGNKSAPLKFITAKRSLETFNLKDTCLFFLCKSLTTHDLFNDNNNKINNNINNNDSNDEMSAYTHHAFRAAVASFCKPLTTFHIRVKSSGVAYPLVAHLILPFLSRI